MRARYLSVAALLCVVVLIASSAPAAERGGLRFSKTVSFELGSTADLGALVGPVKVHNVEFSESGGSKSKLFGKLRSSGDATTKTNLRASFEVENPISEEWEITFTVELLDSKGELIDRFSKKTDFDGEAKIYHVDHTILSYVVPLTSKAEIKLEARLD